MVAYLNCYHSISDHIDFQCIYLFTCTNRIMVVCCGSGRAFNLSVVYKYIATATGNSDFLSDKEVRCRFYSGGSGFWRISLTMYVKLIKSSCLARLFLC